MIEKGEQREAGWQVGRGEIWQILSLALVSPFSRQRLGRGLLHVLSETPVLAGDSSALRFYQSLPPPSLYIFLLAHRCPSLCTLSKMRAFCKIHQPMPAASLCKWLPAMDLYYFTKKHHRRNLFCTTEDMISTLSAALAQCFVCSLERNREERVSLH